ncbi:hypothetical protein B0H13DRAFT_147005 [Mycena leptocephala]|nr:hypothetical protein B0H13DRAFT_147005 [Mycena leptocephala]
MSHKYEVDSLRKRALIHLSSRHPMTLDTWEDVVTQSSWSSSDSHFLETIILARQISALWILPAAFYRAFLLPANALITGDGSFEMSPMTGGRILETTEVSHLLEFLYAPQQIEGCQSPF